MRTILILVFLLYLGTISAKASEREEAFEQIMEVMRENYFDKSFSGTSFLAEADKIKQGIKDFDEDVYYEKVNKLLASLGKSHLHLITSAPQKDEAKVTLNRGSLKERFFTLIPIGDSWYISWLKKGFKSPLHMGMQITHLNDYEIDDLVSKKHPRIEMQQILDYWPRRKITLRQKSGKEITIKLKSPSYEKESFGLASGASFVESEMRSDGILYIGFTLFMPKIVEKVIGELHKHGQEARGVIIDIRNNSGGVGYLACAIARQFSHESNYSLGVQKMGSSTLSFPVFPGERALKVPLVFLVNKESFSTAEILPAGMREIGRACVIGTRSAGQVLPSYIMKLKDGTYFQYPVADFKTPKGVELEGEGVAVDIEVGHNVLSLKAGIDEPLQRAVKYLMKKRK